MTHPKEFGAIMIPHIDTAKNSTLRPSRTELGNYYLFFGTMAAFARYYFTSSLNFAIVLKEYRS
jgi:hypothetical protein